MADETKENEEDVCFDPDAYEDDDDDDDDEGRRGNDDDDDGTRPTTTGTGTGPTIDDALRRATAERRKEMDAFDAMLVEKFPGTTGADARWERALSKISRDASFGRPSRGRKPEIVFRCVRETNARERERWRRSESGRLVRKTR